MDGVPVKIIGEHPHSGRTGRLVEIVTFKHGIMPKMGKVVFDEPNHEDEACFAEPKNLRQVGIRERLNLEAKLRAEGR